MRPEDEEKRPCRVCHRLFHRSGMLGHAYAAHRGEYKNWLEDRGGFGMSIWEHMSLKYIDKPLIRK